MPNGFHANMQIYTICLGISYNAAILNNLYRMPISLILTLDCILVIFFKFSYPATNVCAKKRSRHSHAHIHTDICTHTHTHTARDRMLTTEKICYSDFPKNFDYMNMKVDAEI